MLIYEYTINVKSNSGKEFGFNVASNLRTDFEIMDAIKKAISLPVEAPVKPTNGVSREDKIMELLQDFWDEYNNNKAVVWLRNDNTGQLAIYTRGEYANDLIQFISRLSV